MFGVEDFGSFYFLESIGILNWLKFEFGIWGLGGGESYVVF